MSITIIGDVRFRRDTTTNWAYVNPILADGVIALDITVNDFKVGDGVSNWSALSYWIASGGGVAPIVTPITGGVTANPKTIAHTGMTWPTVLAYDGSGNLYTGYTYVDDGTSIIATGDDDGAGKFIDSFTLIIKV